MTAPSRCRKFRGGQHPDVWVRDRGFQDACLVHPGYGSALVPRVRWRVAQAAEAHVTMTTFSLDKDEMGQTVIQVGLSVLRRFFPYLPAGGDLGRVAEVGCGQFSTTHTLLVGRPDLRAASVALIDPGPVSYTHLTLPTICSV